MAAPAAAVSGREAGGRWPGSAAGDGLAVGDQWPVGAVGQIWSTPSKANAAAIYHVKLTAPLNLPQHPLLKFIWLLG